MRIIRTLVILGAVAVFLPAPPEGTQKGDVEQHALAVPEQGLVVSATLAIADIASFCSRQPTVCATADAIGHHLEAKAKYNVRLVYEWANGPMVAPPETDLEVQTGKADALTTGSTGSEPHSPIRQSTLRIDDLIPVWRGPANNSG